VILTPDEIAELTGKQRQAAQRSELDALGIPYKVRRDGSLVVLRVAAQVALGHVPAQDRPFTPRLRL
jgi:hypothetical protein